MNRKLKESVTSDSIDPTMVAAQRFNTILDQSSGLNYHLQISPFSALISLKKTLIKNKSGKHLQPQNHQVLSKNMKDLIDRNTKFENDVIDLTKKHEEAVYNCKKVYEKINSCQNVQQEELKKTELNMKNYSRKLRN